MKRYNIQADFVLSCTGGMWIVPMENIENDHHEYIKTDSTALKVMSSL